MLTVHKPQEANEDVPALLQRFFEQGKTAQQLMDDGFEASDIQLAERKFKETQQLGSQFIPYFTGYVTKIESAAPQGETKLDSLDEDDFVTDYQDPGSDIDDKLEADELKEGDFVVIERAEKK